MGKDRSHKHTHSFAKNSRLVWNGILEIVEFHRWPRVKKVLPNKRHGIVRHESGDGIQVSGSDPVGTSEIQDFTSAEACRIFETDDVCSISPARRSEATHMKALIAQEMVEDNGRRRQSTTYPVRSQLKRTLSFHHIQPRTSFDVTSAGVNESPNGKNGGNHPLQVENDMETSKFSEDLPKEKPLHSIVDAPPSSPMRPANLVDAAKVVSMKNDTFFKILEDRSYPLFYQLHDGGMVELTKYESFRHTGSSGRHEHSKSELDTPEDIDPTIQKSRISDREKTENQMGEICSKNYEPGISHFTQINGKERRRISLDAVFHRIPHGDQFSTESLGKDRMRDGVFSSPRTEKHIMKRTSSLIESLDRFSQLFPNARAEQENIFGRETRKSLGRIYSSPDLPTPLCSIDDPSDSYVLPLLENSEIDRTGLNKDKTDGSEFEYESNDLLDVECKIRENMSESLSTLSIEAKASMCESSMFSNDDVLDPYHYEDSVDATIEPISKDENVESISKRLLLQDLNSLKTKPSSSTIDTLRIAEEGRQEERVGASTIDIDAEYEQEESVGTSTIDIDAEYEPEFNYIREVLQASGFIGSGSVGSWHSPDQPLDPFLFDKMETYFAAGSGEEEERRKSRVRMLLFDIVNEMLVDHYDQSFTYCPVPPSPALLQVRHRILEKIWGNVRWLLGFRPETDPTLDAITGRDVAKDMGWMHLQFDTECVSLQVEELILDHLIDEVFST